MSQSESQDAKLNNEQKLGINVEMELTVAAHANGYAFFQSTILAAVAIDAQNATLLIFSARTILDLLLNGSSEETL